MKLMSAMAVLALALACAPAQAQSGPEQAGQQACGSDAFSLCGDAIPDRGRIEACLRRSYSRVSAPCRHYMASFGHRKSASRAGRHHYRHHKAVSHHRANRHRHPVRRHKR
jgi:hypothetical protein